MNPEEIEIHGAVRPCGCKNLEKRFHQMGRQVKLTDVSPNDVGRGGVLRWKCTFKGKDAKRGYNFSDDYNNGEMADA